MLPDSVRQLLEEEGTRCKVSLETFTESLIAKLGLTPSQAEQLRAYDRSRVAGNVYLHFPFCFLTAFPKVALEDVRTIALSAVLWMSYMRAQDDTLDRKVPPDPMLLFLRHLYSRESLRLLYKLFFPKSAFWTLYESYVEEYVRAVIGESRHHTVDLPYDHDEFCAIAKGKAAMAKYPVAALSILNGDDQNMSLVTESLDSYYIGYQYWDDIVDWKEDLAASNYSLLLTAALEQLPAQDRQGSPDQLRTKIAHVLYFSGLAEDHLTRAHQSLERARELSNAAGCAVWADCVVRLQAQAHTLANDLRSIMAKCEKGGATSPPTTSARS